jgi:hypothetical protein
MTYSRHLFTGSCTFSTHIGAFSTMLHSAVSMPLALIGTAVTDIGANAAELLTEASAHAHHMGGSGTYGGTFQVQLDTCTQRVYILFVQAGHSTMVAFHSTRLTCFNTLLILLM